MIRILYKPTCSTCRKALNLIKEISDENVELTEYMVKTPSESEIRLLLKMLGIKAEDLVRKKEALYREKFAGKKLSETQWIKILHRHPELIERPVIISGNRAIIGRPPERVIDFLKK